MTQTEEGGKQWETIVEYLNAPQGHGEAVLQLAVAQQRLPTQPARRPPGGG
jgi:hypothetical protein